MKIKPILYALALLMSIINAMERDDWQKTPGQQLGGRGQQSSLIPTTRRPSSPPRRPASPPTPSAAGPASVAGRSPTAPSAGAPTTPSSMPPAGFMRSGQRQSGAALPPSEVESKSTTSMTTSPEITPATAAASVQESSKIPGSITLQSNISAQPRDHIIRPDAIQYAQTIKTMVDVSEDTQTPIEIPYPYT